MLDKLFNNRTLKEFLEADIPHDPNCCQKCGFMHSDSWVEMVWHEKRIRYCYACATDWLSEKV